MGPAERRYIAEGAEQNIRNDGRGRLDYRYFNVQTGVIPNASGSARITLDETDVIVAVKAEIGSPALETPKSGRVECTVEVSSSASQEFEGSGARTLNVALSSELSRVLSDSKCIDVDALCVIPDKSCWVLYVDAVVLDNGGNLLDAITLATKAALRTTLIPAVTVVQGDGDDQPEIEVSDDPFDAKAVDDSSVPITVTLNKIGNRFVVDATLDEEECTAVRLSVAVDRKGHVRGTYKSGIGAIAPAALFEALAVAQKIGVELNARVEKVITRPSVASA